MLVDYESNLALLEVRSPGFWQGLRPLPISPRPVRNGRFIINRWRSNGRFQQGGGEVVDYLVTTSPFGLMEFPAMRGITALEGLGWAEALTENGAIVGLITSHNKQQIQAVNGDVIRLMVTAARKTPYKGFAHRGFAWQRLNHPHMRAFHGLGDKDGGVLIRHLYPGGTGSGTLKVMDILHKINGYTIDPEGKIEHPAYGPMRFTIAFNETLAPEIPVVIRRNGKLLKLKLKRTLFSGRDYRVHPPRFDRPDDYEVFGGLVIQELSVNYLRAWGEKWRTKAPSRLVMEYEMNIIRSDPKQSEKVLIISKVLPDPANLGYENVNNAIILRLNGQPAGTLAAFRKAMETPIQGHHLLDIMPGQGRGRLVYRAGVMPRINARVRRRYDIPAPDSGRR